MENLDRLTRAGLSYFDSNTEVLDSHDWSHTGVGERSKWHQNLHAYVNFISTLPHPAAVFWGSSLCMIHNITWATCLPEKNLQGCDAKDCFKGEGLASLETSLSGRTVQVAYAFLLQKNADYAENATILLCPLLGCDGNRQGVLAQLLHSPPPSERPLDMILHGNSEADKQDESGREKPDKEGKTEIDLQQGGSSGRKNPEKINLKESGLFRRFAQILPNGLAILDDKAEALFVNDDFYRLTTHRSSKTFRAWPESIHPDDYQVIMSEYRHAIERNDEMRVEFRCADVTEGANTPWRLFIMRPLNIWNDRLTGPAQEETPDRTGFICAVVDITEQKAAEHSQRAAAEEARDRKKQQESFVDMVSHEIRNPLSAILHSAGEINEACSSLQKIVNDSEHVAIITEAADTILLCAQHQNALVDDILSFSKLDASMLSLTPAPTQPSSGFGESFRLFSPELKAKQIGFDYVLDTSYNEQKVDWVMADLRRLRQILVNLISNAMKFTANKQGDRKITVAMGASKERPTSYPPNVVFFDTAPEHYKLNNINSNAWGKGEALYLLVAVKDSGIGMSDEAQKQLFERFRQATPRTQEQYGGSGLGLFISRKLCQLHGGEIGVASKHGEGSTFGFFFKVKRTEKPSDKQDSVGGAGEEARSSLSHRPKTLAGGAHDRKSEPLVNRKGPGQGDADKKYLNMRQPRTEFRAEAHPQAVEVTSKDNRYDRTSGISDEVSNGTPLSPTSASRGKANAKRDSKEAKDDSSRDHGKILLVEDNEINAKVLGRQLKNKGFQVMTAHNGQEAIDMLKRIASDTASQEKGTRIGPNRVHPDVFDCILMDQEMPIKDGNTAAKEIRGFNDHVPILGVSANARQEQIQSMRDAGMNDTISKPFKVDELVNKIHGLLEQAAQNRGET